MQGRWDAKRFATLLDEAVAKTGVNPYLLAQMAGFHGAQIGRWRTGKSRPAYDTLAKLTAVLIREDCALAGVIPALFEAAGYGPPVTDLAALPEIVAGNWDDPVVREIWDGGLPDFSRLRVVQIYLDERDTHRDEPGPPRLAASGG